MIVAAAVHIDGITPERRTRTFDGYAGERVDCSWVEAPGERRAIIERPCGTLFELRAAYCSQTGAIRLTPPRAVYVVRSIALLAAFGESVSALLWPYTV